MVGFFQGLLNQGEDELLLGDLPALPLGLCGDVGLELLKEFLGDLNCQGSSSCHGVVSSFIVFC